MEKKTHITSAEWPIMQVLWRCETASASDIVHAVQAKKDISMRTVKTLIRRLVAKGAAGYTVDEKNPRIYHYHALVTQESCTGERAEAFMKTMADSEMGEVLMRFVGGSKLSKKQIETLEQMLRQKKDEL